MELTLIMEVPGVVDLSERGKQYVAPDGALGGWSNTKLVCMPDSEVTITLDLGEDGIPQLGISAHHVENSETKRVFHTHVTGALTATELRALIKGAQYLADNLPEGVV